MSKTNIDFRHKGLKRLYEKDDLSAVSPKQVNKIKRILARLDAATKPADMNIPGFNLHPLKGDRKGYWSVSVSGNWRIIFRFNDDRACDINLVDYH